MGKQCRRTLGKSGRIYQKDLPPLGKTVDSTATAVTAALPAEQPMTGSFSDLHTEDPTIGYDNRSKD
jgi:hypothetical protein